MMTPHELIVAAGVAIAAASYLCGSLAPWWRILEWAHRGYLDDIYDEGYEDARRAGRDTMAGPWLAGPSQAGYEDDLRLPAPAQLDRSPDPAAGLVEGRGRAHQPIRVDPAVHASGDWRADYAEQLAPAVLDAENLPGQDPSINEEARAAARQTLAGEHHEEFPLPAILHLGAEYDGGDQTFARVQLRQMTAINRHEAARKALCDECGVPFVPMEMIAA